MTKGTLFTENKLPSTHAFKLEFELIPFHGFPQRLHLMVFNIFSSDKIEGVTSLITFQVSQINTNSENLQSVQASDRLLQNQTQTSSDLECMA